MPSIFQQLFKDHHKYYESSVNTRRFKYEDIIDLIKDLSGRERFSLDIVGKSFQGRDIYQIKWGTGDIQILLWSQMHGDESTATRALLDIFNFLKAQGDSNDDMRSELAGMVTLNFVPVLNPDGTNEWQRRTMQGIDMNRDAVRLQTPEARILKTLCKEIKPLFGFNLHDQSPYYSAGFASKPATISFLSPAYNKSKDVNDVRGRSMKLIGYLNQYLQKVVPGHVGKYDDTFNPRAFGDNIQKWGISTVLVESGGYTGDPEKEFVRKLNFGLLLDAIWSIGKGFYEEVDIMEYEKIPFNNKEYFFDLIIRNAVIKRNGLEYKVDIAINHEENDYNNHRNFYYKGMIVDIGDMSNFYGYEDIDLNGMVLEPGKEYPYIFDTHEEALNFDMVKVLANGYTHVIIDDAISNEQFTDLPVNILLDDEELQLEIILGEPANMIAREEGEVKFTIVNGFLFKHDEENLGIRNGLVLNGR